MDLESQTSLARLIRKGRVASLGTLRRGAPFVSMVPYAVSPDFSEFYIHISRLAHHTQDLQQDARAGLMIAEADAGEKDPQVLARLSLTGFFEPIPAGSDDYRAAKSAYLAKFPQSAQNFSLADFSLYRLRLQSGRFVAGFGKIFNLTPDYFVQVSEIQAGW
jgi:putative heme iron utilization protein